MKLIKAKRKFGSERWVTGAGFIDFKNTKALGSNIINIQGHYLLAPLGISHGNSFPLAQIVQVLGKIIPEFSIRKQLSVFLRQIEHWYN